MIKILFFNKYTYLSNSTLFQDWLLLPCPKWSLFPPFQKLAEFARNLSVSNELAERVS